MYQSLTVVLFAVAALICNDGAAQTFVATSASTAPWWQLATSSNGMTAYASVAANAGVNPVSYSTNGGASWSTASLPSGNTFFLTCSADGTKAAAAMWYGTIYLSTNSGVSWFQTTAPNRLWWAAMRSSSDGSTLVASVWGLGIYSSTDSGHTWNLGNAPAENWFTLAISSDGKRCFAGAAAGEPLYSSSDSGKTWSPLNMPSIEWGAIACSADGTKVFAMPFATGDPYCISTDSGATWMTNAIPSPGWEDVACSGDGRQLVAAGPNSLFTSSDSGTTWTPCCNGGNWQAVASSSDSTCIFAAKYGGQIYSTAMPSIPLGPTTAPRTGWTCLSASSDGRRLVEIGR